MARQSQPRLMLICGLPGAGKTTLAQRLAAEVPAIRLCPDEWMTHLGIDLYEAVRERLERMSWLHAQDLLRLGVSVILESGFWLLASGCAQIAMRSAHERAPRIGCLRPSVNNEMTSQRVGSHLIIAFVVVGATYAQRIRPSSKGDASPGW